MLKILKWISCLLIAFTICIGGSCQHIHNSDCGYDPTTDSGCQHVHPLNEWEPPIG